MLASMVEAWVRSYRSFGLVLVHLAAFQCGLVADSGSRALEILATLSFASAIVLSCALDAKLHGKVFVRSFSRILMMTWPVGILAHLFWTRRWRGLLTYALLLLGFLASLGAGAALRQLVTGE